jgi:hypothetical protein
MRFKLSSLMLSVFCLAIYMGIACLPQPYAGFPLLLLSILLSPVCLGGLVYARGYWRAFWIGFALVQYEAYRLLTFQVVAPLQNARSLGDLVEYTGNLDKDIFIWFHFWSLSSGLVVVMTRWIYLRGEQSARDAETSEEE